MAAAYYAHGSTASFTFTSDEPNEPYQLTVSGNEGAGHGATTSGTSDGNGGGSGTITVPAPDIYSGLYAVQLYFGVTGTGCETSFTSSVAPPAAP
jgi:hypothetical protein